MGVMEEVGVIVEQEVRVVEVMEEVEEVGVMVDEEVRVVGVMEEGGGSSYSELSLRSHQLSR